MLLIKDKILSKKPYLLNISLTLSERTGCRFPKLNCFSEFYKAYQILGPLNLILSAPFKSVYTKGYYIEHFLLFFKVFLL